MPTIEELDDLATALADIREDAAVLGRTGHPDQAKYLEERVCDRIAKVSRDFTRWLSMNDARLKSGLAVRTLNRRFAELQDCGLARYNARNEREFLACAVPPRPQPEEARERGRRAVG